MIERVVVLGGGSAGLLTAITLKTRLPRLRVTLLRSKEMGVIGVGEGTMPDFLALLHGYLGIDPALFQREVNPAPKLGAKLLWGPRPSFNFSFGINVLRNYRELARPTGFYCQEDMENLSEPSALMSEGKALERAEKGLMRASHNVGYHVDNERLVRFLEGHCTSIGVDLRDERVEQIRQDEAGVAALHTRTGGVFEADLFIDSSGFGSVLLGKTMAEPYVSYASTLYCDRAIVGDWERSGEPILPYTTVQTMNAGWCWQIEHPDRIARGYVYSSAFISDDQAEQEFRRTAPRAGAARLLKFPSGRYQHAWVKNVVGVGNAGGFVEPLGATSLAMICRDARRLAETLQQSQMDPGLASIRMYNAMSARAWESIRDFLAVHYRFNTRLDPPFWRACRADVDLCGAADIVEYFQEEGPGEWGLNLTHLSMPPFGFLPDAFYCILLGQRVPSRREHRPTESEATFLAGLRTHHASVAARAFTPEQAIELLRRPYPGWDSAFFAELKF